MKRYEFVVRCKASEPNTSHYYEFVVRATSKRSAVAELKKSYPGCIGYELVEVL